MINKTNINLSYNVSKGVTRSSLLLLSKLKGLTPLNLPRVNKSYLVALLDSHVIHYPSPITLTYAWSFGALAGICLVIQILSGIFLAMHYTPNIELAFNSVEHIMRDVKNGWLIRYIHANGASMFFIVIYAHMCRGLYYGSYMKPRELLWCSGVVIFLLMMGTAFTGYVLPWGQMSFWGATVITSMVTAIPIAGQPIVQWLWGGYTVGNPTLNRFFSLHFFLPFLIAGFSLIHLALLHKEGSNSPIGSDTGVDDLPFYPYFAVKDVFAFFTFLLIFATFVFYFPNTLNHPDNYIPADPLQTPAHVVPEWYFLPYYAILRSIPHKVGGITAMLGSILVLLAIPYTNSSYVRNTTYRPIFKICFWLFICDFIILTWVGQKPVRDTFVIVGQVATLYYFVFFLILIPIVGKVEWALVNHKVVNSLKSTLAQVTSSGELPVPQYESNFNRLPEPARTFVEFVLDLFYYLILFTFFVLSIMYKSYLVATGFVVFFSVIVLMRTSEKVPVSFGTSSHIISEVDKIYKSMLGGALYYGVYLTKLLFLAAYLILMIVAESHYFEIKAVVLSGVVSSSEPYWVFLTDLSGALRFLSPVFVAAIVLEFLVKLGITVQFKPTLLSPRKKFKASNLIKGRRFFSGGPRIKRFGRKLLALRGGIAAGAASAGAGAAGAGAAGAGSAGASAAGAGAFLGAGLGGTAAALIISNRERINNPTGAPINNLNVAGSNYGAVGGAIGGSALGGGLGGAAGGLLVHLGYLPTMVAVGAFAVRSVSMLSVPLLTSSAATAVFFALYGTPAWEYYHYGYIIPADDAVRANHQWLLFTLGEGVGRTSLNEQLDLARLFGRDRVLNASILEAVLVDPAHRNVLFSIHPDELWRRFTPTRSLALALLDNQHLYYGHEPAPVPIPRQSLLEYFSRHPAAPQLGGDTANVPSNALVRSPGQQIISRQFPH